MGLAQLPAELQIEILGYLERRDIKAARCVSSKFRDHASPYVFSHVVACARYQALSAMQKISLHPVYQRYVKGIIFDGSVYNQGLASNFERYQKRADQNTEICSGFHWEKIKRHQRYKQLFQDQEDMRTGGVLLAEVSRALECMPNVSSIVYSPVPREVPIEHNAMRDILPRGVGDERLVGDDFLNVSYIDSTHHGIDLLIGSIYASQYSGIREFHVETANHRQAGTEFTIYMFDFLDPEHLLAGRYFFHQLHKLTMKISLGLGNPRFRPPNIQQPAHAGHNLPIATQHNALLGVVPQNMPENTGGLTPLSNLADLLFEAKDLRELTLHLTHWNASAHRMYGHIISPTHPIFPYLGLNGKWSYLRSLSLGGIHATEEELMRLVSRHRETLEDVEFRYCSLFSGFWANIVDELISNASVISFSLDRVNETVLGDRNFTDLTREEMDQWKYVGYLKLTSEGLRYFDEPNGKTVYSGPRLSSGKN